MSNLIVTVIAIALVAVTVLAATYYGGQAWTSYQAEARASALLNEAQQITGAMNLATGIGKPVAQMADLTDTGSAVGAYFGGNQVLSEAPAGDQGWQICGETAGDITGCTESVVFTQLADDADSTDVCLSALKRLGFAANDATDIPVCSDDAAAPCCTCTGADTGVAPYCL